MAREKKSINEVIVEIANRLAVKRNGEEVVSDDFQGFWECFWNSLQHDRVSFAEALERATESTQWSACGHEATAGFST